MERLRKLKKKLARPGDLKCGWCFFGDKFGPTPSHLLSTSIGYPHVAWRNLGLFRCKHTGVEELIVNPFIFSGADSSFIHAGLLRILHRNVCSRRLHAHDAFRRFCRAYFPDGCSFFLRFGTASKPCRRSGTTWLLLGDCESRSIQPNGTGWIGVIF